MSITNLVKMMHNKFGITSEKVPFSEEEKKFRICAMQEELDEYKEAETKEDQLDALVDLVVFAMGTAERQGMLEVFDEAFKRVMIANCKKEKRGSFQLDLVKPEGWTAPDLSDLVFDCESTSLEEILEKCKVLAKEKLDKNIVTRDELRRFLVSELKVENFGQLDKQGLTVLYKNLIETN